MIGPWSHGGLTDQSVGQDSSFDQPKHSMAFINRCCDHTPANAPDFTQTHSSTQAQAQQQLPSIVNGAAQPDKDRVLSGFVQTHTSEAKSSGTSQKSSKAEEDAALPSVHFFMMGDEAHRGWKASHSWPPPAPSSPPLKLFLNKAPGPMLKPKRAWFMSSKKSARVTSTQDPASQVLILAIITTRHNSPLMKSTFVVVKMIVSSLC